MIKIDMGPYPSNVWFTTDFEEFKRAYKRMDGRTWTRGTNEVLGTSQELYGKYSGHLVYARKGRVTTYVHEFTHVLLNLFTYIGLKPASGHGEAFAYMLGHMLKQVGVK